MRSPLLLLLVSLSILTASRAETVDGRFPVDSNLRAGVAKVDITPAVVADFSVTGHRRNVSGVRDPLRAAVLILDDGETKAAIVTMDTIGAWDAMVKQARPRIEKETGEVHAIRALEHHRRLCRPLLPGSPGGLLLSLLPLGLSSESAAGHILVILVLFRV